MDLSKYRYVYNAAAHFAAVEKYPDGLVPELMKPGVAGFDALCWALAEIAMQAELIRRDMGYDRQEPPSEAALRAQMTCRNINEARTIVMNAIVKGLGKDGGGEVDEILAEIQKKTETG